MRLSPNDSAQPTSAQSGLPTSPAANEPSPSVPAPRPASQRFTSSHDGTTRQGASSRASTGATKVSTLNPQTSATTSAPALYWKAAATYGFGRPESELSRIRSLAMRLWDLREKVRTAREVAVDVDRITLLLGQLVEDNYHNDVTDEKWKAVVQFVLRSDWTYRKPKTIYRSDFDPSAAQLNAIGMGAISLVDHQRIVDALTIRLTHENYERGLADGLARAQNPDVQRQYFDETQKVLREVFGREDRIDHLSDRVERLEKDLEYEKNRARKLREVNDELKQRLQDVQKHTSSLLAPKD